MVKHLKTLFLLLLCGGLFAQVANRPNDELVQRTLLSGVENTLSVEDLSYQVTDFYTNKKNGIQHIYLRQQYNGLEIIGTESSIHIASDGKLSSIKNNFVNSVEKRGHNAAKTPQIDALQAVNSAVSHLGYTTSKSLIVVAKEFGPNQKTLISDGGFSKSNIQAELFYLLNDEGELTLVWQFAIESDNNTDWYNLRVDASTGKVINKNNWISSCNFEHDYEGDAEDYWHFHDGKFIDSEERTDAPQALLGSYMVFEMPVESPYYGDRTLVLADDAVNLNASPFGWHDTNGVEGPEYTTTRGNNVNAYEDGDNPNFQPDGGSNLAFNFPFNPTYSYSDQSESAAITNLFYWNNIIHDVFYEYGFDEVSGNFQQNNYGKGGLGNDFVRAEAQDGSGTCNANFGTPPDGQSPTMQMYVCGPRDGDFDNVVIMHEYGHGITIRLTGGPSNVDCLWNQEQMGEGWGDWFGMMLTMKPGDQGTDARGIGTWLFNDGPNGPGIRTYPYSTDMSINPHTYDSIKSEVVPHGVGSVWAVMLWDMTWALIDKYGFDEDIYNGTGGNNVALSLVVEALKLQPCSPGFVDGRDAILEADQLLYGGDNQCLIWDVFARRGLGVSASQGSSDSRSDGVEAFDSMSGEAEFIAPNDICIEIPVMTGLSGGTPMGGVYSGPGVTDDGNGKTYSFNPEVAGLGTHTITYTVPETDCSPGSSASDTIEVTPGLTVACPDDITVNTDGSDCSAVVVYDSPQGFSTCSAGNEESFDNVSVPSLPNGWTSTTEQGNNSWETVSNQSTSSPNSAFASNPSSTSLTSLVSPSYLLDSSNAKLKFDIRYQTENIYDGVVLEYSTNNGNTWQDILNGGGSFGSSGYNGTINSYWGNPLAGRQAWTGNSGGFKSVTVNLNSSMNGQSVKFRWRIGTDSMVGSTGVWIDTVVVEGVFTPDPVITQIAGLPSGSEFPAGVTTNVFEMDDGAGGTVTCSFDVIVNDGVAPEISCPEDHTISLQPTEAYTVPDYWADGSVTATDNCTEVQNQTQTPAPGTVLGNGTYTVTFTVEDGAGNLSECTFELTVEGGLGTKEFDLNSEIEISPNPTRDNVMILNSSKQKIEIIRILDVSGKLIREVKVNNADKENTISVKSYPTGTYILQIIGEKQTVVKKLIKK